MFFRSYVSLRKGKSNGEFSIPMGVATNAKLGLIIPAVLINPLCPIFFL